MLVLALILAVAILHTLVVYIFQKFTYVNRKGIWIFIFSAIAYGFLFLHLVFRWKNQTITWVEKNLAIKFISQKIHAFSQAYFWYRITFNERANFIFGECILWNLLRMG